MVKNSFILLQKQVKKVIMILPSNSKKCELNKIETRISLRGQQIE